MDKWKVILWTIVLGFVVLRIFLIFLEKNDQKKKVQKQKETHTIRGICGNIRELERYDNSRYIGGFEKTKLEPEKLINFIIYHDRLTFEKGLKDIDIMIQNVVSCQLISSIQLQEKISMGKVLMFGVFALGMDKKKTQKIERYVEVIVKDECIEYPIYFKNENKDIEIVKNINKLIIKEDINIKENIIVEN